uniref:ABC transporter permease n=1 Tax=Anaerolinea thermolimosa TaxID=229919 RepID=A0A7C4KHX8_9CHLR
MTLLKEYILPRILQWAVVVFVGVTITFLIPRLSPVNPVDQAIARITTFQSMDPDAMLMARATLEDLYGLKGSIVDQYIAYWRRVLKGDLGPSFLAFPTPVSKMIGAGIGWTVGLLATSLIISWLLGIILGSLAGYFPNRWWSQVIEKTLVTVYPVPYFILSFVLLMLFTYYWPIFPLVGGAKGTPGFNWDYISSVLHHSFLPALSIIIGGTAFRFIMARALAFAEANSNYVQFAEIAALPKMKILVSYIIRNTMLPHVNDLALSLGAVFEGALITEVVFSYPGIGYTLYSAINAGDYNLIMGITLLSIVGIATASLLVDLSYPLFDPRVRYR